MIICNKISIEFLITHPIGTAVLIFGICLFVLVFSKCVKNPIDKILSALNVLKEELINFKTMKDYCKVDIIGVILFFLVFISELIIIMTPSYLSSIFGGKAIEVPSLVIITLIFFFIICIFSALLVLFTDAEESVKKDSDRLQ